MFYNEKQFIENGTKHMEEEDYATARLEFEKALNLIPAKNKKERKEVKKNFIFCSEKLADSHFQYGLNFLEDGKYERALDDFNAAMLLTEDSNKKKEIEKKLKKIEELIEREEILSYIKENLEHGNDFYEKKQYAEAYVEFKEAWEVTRNFKNLKDINEDLKEKLTRIEHFLVRKYLKTSKKHISSGKYEHALEELQQAQAIVDDFDVEDVKEIEKLYKQVKKHLMGEIFLKDNKSREKMLEKAIEEFEHYTDLYFKFVFSEANPYNPTAGNKYEKLYNIKRKNLAIVYEKIGDEYTAEGKYAVGLKFYQDALSVLNEDEVEYVEVSGKVEVAKRLKENK
ncbi:MAG: hypothetical protein ACQESP_09825 [Candidatus Muiribacteriota bacterium]